MLSNVGSDETFNASEEWVFTWVNERKPIHWDYPQSYFRKWQHKWYKEPKNCNHSSLGSVCSTNSKSKNGQGFPFRTINIRNHGMALRRAKTSFYDNNSTCKCSACFRFRLNRTPETVIYIYIKQQHYSVALEFIMIFRRCFKAKRVGVVFEFQCFV
jgi:hypothetical protein